MGVQQYGNSLYHLTEGKAIVVLSSVEDIQDNNGSLAAAKGDSDIIIKEWGANNDLPTERELLVAENNIVPSLLATKRDVTLGHDLMAYRERFSGGSKIVEQVEIPTQAAEFFDQVDIDSYLMCATRNLLFHANTFTEFLRGTADNDDIVSMKALECRHVRAQQQDVNGRINNYYWRGNWKPDGRKSRVAESNYPISTIPNYDPDLNRKQKKFMYHCFDDLLQVDEYYPSPYWWGSKNWIQLANCIPEFHKANLKHGYSIRYHIEVPKDYFYDHTSQQLSPDEVKQAKETAEEAKKNFLDNLNKFLAGVEKSGRAIVTQYEINRALGKEFPGIKITPLKVDLKDEALLGLFDKSNEANTSAQGIHPTLANIQTQGKLSSGSEIRNAFLLYVAIKTPLPRRILLKPIHFLARQNGWDRSIKYGFKDIEIKTLDEDKTGSNEIMTQ